MAKPIMIDEELYTRIKKLKGSKSFNRFLKEMLYEEIYTKSEYQKKRINDMLIALEDEVPELLETIELCRVLLIKAIDIEKEKVVEINSRILGTIREET